jgi:hypothetical protein
MRRMTEAESVVLMVEAQRLRAERKESDTWDDRFKQQGELLSFAYVQVSPEIGEAQ